jgi:BlaI family transcriptional regulator, penicillinase repressor
MPKKESASPRLGRLETQIMSVVWRRGTATVHEVRDTLGRGKKPAYSTILTMMRKLEAKGFLEHSVHDRKYVYRAVIDQQRVRRSVIRDLVERLFDGSPALLVSSLLEQQGVSDGEMAEIKKLMRTWEGRI